MTISIDRYVAITSGVIGAQVVAMRELVGLRFTTNPRVPAGSVVTLGRGDANDFFGAGSPEAVFASQYFAYISPAPVSQAQSLRFAPYVDADRPARIYGARPVSSLTALQDVINGMLALLLGGQSLVITGLNFSAALTMADVASTVQAAIRAAHPENPHWSTATVSYDAVAGVFNLVSGTAGNADISLAAAGASDVAPALGWRAAGTVFSPGAVAQTPLEALRAAENVTDSFGSLSYTGGITLAQAIEVAAYVAELNVKYQFYHVVDVLTWNAAFAALAQFASTGLVLNGLAGEFKESLPAAIMAATNYARRNATINYMYRQGPFANDNDVADDQLANALDAARVNYYGTTASAGQKLAFFQRGYLLGGATAPLDMNVHANEQWLKAAIQTDVLSAQLSLNKISADLAGRGQLLVILQGRIDQAKFNGTITVGKTLTRLQQVAVEQLTGDPDAWRDVETNGYWLDVNIVPETGPSDTTEYVAYYTLAYSKNDVVRTVKGSHNLI